MATIEKSIEIEAPVSSVYNQWTRFEQFPQFMENVVEVRQLDDRRLHWVAEIGGKQEEWDAEIVEQVPDRVIAWHAIGGKENAGRVEFAEEGRGATRVTLRMDYEPEGIMEKAGSMLGMDSMHVENDLERFKDMIENGDATGPGWRGEVHGDRIDDSRMPGGPLPGGTTEAPLSARRPVGVGDDLPNDSLGRDTSRMPGI